MIYDCNFLRLKSAKSLNGKLKLFKTPNFHWPKLSIKRKKQATLASQWDDKSFYTFISTTGSQCSQNDQFMIFHRNFIDPFSRNLVQTLEACFLLLIRLSISPTIIGNASFNCS